DFENGSVYRAHPSQTPVSFEERSFDLLLSAGALLEYSEDLPRALEKFACLLRPGGSALFIGIRSNLIGRIQSKLWHFRLRKTQESLAAARPLFSKVRPVRIPLRFF